jgi:hypothetical protein
MTLKVLTRYDVYLPMVVYQTEVVPRLRFALLFGQPEGGM